MKNQKCNIKKNKVVAEVPQMDLMAKAHGLALSLTREAVKELNEFRFFNQEDNSNSVLAQRAALTAKTLARTKAVDNFFDICQKSEPVVAIDKDTLQREMAMRPQNIKHVMSIYLTEYRQMVRVIKEMIKGPQGVTIYDLKKGTKENIILVDSQSR